MTKSNLHPIGTIVKLYYKSYAYGIVVGHQEKVFNIVKWLESSQKPECDAFLSSLLEPI